MKEFIVSDVTLHEASAQGEFHLSFREKIEIAKRLDNLGVGVIETAGIVSAKVDSLLIKSMAAAVSQSVLSVPVSLRQGGAAEAWDAVKSARRPRLRVSVPVSAVQMEYLLRKKPPEILAMIQAVVAEAKRYCQDVEFAAQDATRAEPDFLRSAIEAAVDAGCTSVTVCDSAGTMLPDEFSAFVKTILQMVPSGVRVGAACSNTLNIACACLFAAMQAGCTEIKVSASCRDLPSLEAMAQIIRTRGDDLGMACSIRYTELQRTIQQIQWIIESKRSKACALASALPDTERADLSLNSFDDRAAVDTAVMKLGYDLSEEDSEKVYAEFLRLAEKKTVGGKELDAIVASVALQVPPTYQLESYLINSGSVIRASANIQLKKGEKLLEGICVGDGPIDAAFLTIEQIIGHHYELDDFQIQAVTEGREAMGAALVRLRSGGKLYSGRGISTDIIGSSIRAYLNAVNKIVYEENEA